MRSLFLLSVIVFKSNIEAPQVWKLVARYQFCNDRVCVDNYITNIVYWVILKNATTHNHPQPSTTIHNYPQLSTTTRNHLQPSPTTHKLPEPSTTTYNHPQPSTTSYNHPQPSKISHNHPKTTHNHSQPSTTTQKTTHNHPQPTATTQKLFKKAKAYHKQWCYSTLDVNTETDVEFDSDMKQWYMYTCVCLCVCTSQVIKLTIVWLGWLFVYVSIKRNSFDVKSDDFCLLKI